MIKLRATWHSYMCFILIMIFMLFINFASVLAVETQSTEGTKFQTNQTANPGVLKGKLIFSHVIYRHGDRTPVEPYPTDPWKDVTAWPVGWGQLTNTGRYQEYNLGKWLRKRYNSILGSRYSKDEIYVRSTDVDRTLMSALSNLAGLYPPEADQIWNPNLLWQPIPVHTVPEKMDWILAGKAPCPAYDYAFNNLRNSPEFKKINNHYQPLYDYLSKYSGLRVDQIETVQRINNTLLIESIYNKTLPAWTKQVYPSPEMSFLSELTFAMYTYTRQLARLRVGPLIKEMFDRFVNKTNQKLFPNRSVWVYSGHDTTLVNLLNALKLYEWHSPPYASCLLLELRLDDQQNPFVSIFYKNSSDEPQPLNIPDCGIACPLKKLYSLYDDILPLNWAHECQISPVMRTLEDVNLGSAMGILVSVITITLFLSYLLMIYYRRRSYRNYFSYIQNWSSNSAV